MRWACLSGRRIGYEESNDTAREASPILAKPPKAFNGADGCRRGGASHPSVSWAVVRSAKVAACRKRQESRDSGRALSARRRCNLADNCDAKVYGPWHGHRKGRRCPHM